MNKLTKKLNQVAADDAGTETIEFALVLGLIIVTCIVIIGAFGTRVLARWTSANSSM